MITATKAPEIAPVETESQVAAETTTEIPREALSSAPQRRGDVSKCPICGSAIDPQAFHCAQCHNYFCFHCRALLHKSHKHLTCRDQSCDYYAKPICSVCDPPYTQDEPPSVFVEPLDGYWPLWLILSLIAGGVTWYYASLSAAAWVAIGLFILGGILLHFTVINIFGGERRVIEPRTSTHYACIRCRQPATEVPPVA